MVKNLGITSGGMLQGNIGDPEIWGAAIRYGYAALHFAASHGDMSLVKALLENGADPLPKDVRGNTAFQVATHLSIMSYFPDMRNAMVDLLTDKACPS